MTNLPTGTVTFLLTDIEGSTKLWERYPEAMQAALAQHDALLANAVAAHGGVRIKTTGDGLHAVFADAADAVAAIVAGQRELAAAMWGETGALRVRMGLHSGGAELRAGDYYGATLNRAARLMAIGHGGQMLLSSATADLVRDRLLEGCTLRDLGEHRLKDLVQPEHVSQLCAPGLPTDFPPLNSLNAFPNNLPVQLTSFVGRERELAEVRRLLTGDGGRTVDEGTSKRVNEGIIRREPAKPALNAVRLLTLTGPGGTGKTRLSLQAAAEALEAFPGGAWLVELAPLADAALLPQRVASVFGLREVPGHDIREILVDYLRAKRLLLILDNCEHLIEACARLADELLHACPQLTILASSREALGIAGETAYRVPSLACPRTSGQQSAIGHQPSTVSSQQLEWLDYDAVQLFAARATAVQPRFALTDQNATAIVQICQRLDGIPLAIELATARLKLFSAEQIAARLDDRFRLLTGGSRTALPRQQTLGALIDWSYDLLSEAERALLRRLSVFAGGWSFEAAEAVCGDDGRPFDTLRAGSTAEGGQTPEQPSAVFRLPSAEVLDLLAQLVNKSLVVAEEPNEDGEVRYRYLETIRQYARDKLLASGEAAWTRERHLAWFVQASEEARPHLIRREQIEWQHRLEHEHDNLRAALEWAVERNPLAAMRMVGSLHFFWTYSGFEGEGRRWANSALTAFGRLAPADAAGPAWKAARAWTLVGLGTLTFAQGEMDASKSALAEAIVLARTIDDPDMRIFALSVGAFAHSMTGSFAQAATLAREGIAYGATHPNTGLQAWFGGVLSRDAILVQHDIGLAKRHIEESVRSARALGHPFSLAMTLYGAAILEGMSGEPVAARAHLAESQEWMRKMGNRPRAIGIQSELAHLARRDGTYPEAIRLYRETLTALQEFGHRGGIARNLECLGFIANAQDQPQRAARLIGAAESLRELSRIAMMPEEVSETAQEVNAMRAQLPAPEFDAAWAEGRALDMDQAIAYALRDE